MDSNDPGINSSGSSTQETAASRSVSASPNDRDSLNTLHESFADYSSAGAVLSQLIYPTSPTLGRRYDLCRPVKDEDPKYNVKPLSIYFRNGEELPHGWQRYVHPEGLPYFCLPPSEGCPMRILTEEWLFEADTARLIEDFLRDIRNAIHQFDVLIPPMSDLVLELCKNEEIDKWMCGYYFVHHPTRTIYWLEEVEIEHQSEPVKEVRGNISGFQIETCLESEYWTYWDTFPNVQTLTPEIYEYAVDTLVSAMTDVISSPSSTITYTHESLQNMLNVVRVSKDCRTSNWHIGRFMKHIIQDRLRNYYGVWGARLSRYQSVLQVSNPERRSKFFWAFSPFLFFIPHAQLKRVEPLVVDRSVITIHWDKFFQELQEEWNQTMTVATIMLAANCAFLAIPIFQAPPPDTHSTPEQVASYLSLTSSLFGLILSMVMYRQHKAHRPSTPDGILKHIFNETRSGPRHRLEHLVLIWSLPHALVLWSVVTFLLAFLIMCFFGTLIATKVVVALSTAFLSSLIFYYVIRFGSGKKLRQNWPSNLSMGLHRVKGLIQRSRKREEAEAKEQVEEQVV